MTTKDQYDEIFYRECVSVYSEVAAFEVVCQFAVETNRLELAARVLACPLKAHPPSWAHGRVIYAAARRLLVDDIDEGVFLDIGTAKGFSAVVMSWAIDDAQAGKRYAVRSVDVIDPLARVPRNSVADLSGSLQTVYELVGPFVALDVDTKFYGGGSVALLKQLVVEGARVRFAFIDGKHTLESVTAELGHLSVLQRRGDVTVIDDLQLSQVDLAVSRLRGYDVTKLNAGPLRRYAVAVRQ